MSDQLLLVEESWREFFILSAAQYLPPIDFPYLLNTNELINQNREKSNMTFLQEAESFKEVLDKLRQFQIDATEYTCLREIVLYKTNIESDMANTSTSSGGSPCSTSNDGRNILDVSTVRNLHEKAKTALAHHDSITYSNQPHRYRSLIQTLPILRTVSISTIQELFCLLGAIPHVSINKLATEIYCQTKI